LQTTAEGEAIFQQNCASCHTIGSGKLVGPDLQGVTERRDVAWIHNFILNPNKVITSGDPLAQSLVAEYNNLTMPTLGLTPTQVDSVIAYLQSSSAGTAANQAPAPAKAPAAGTAARGKAIFSGAAPLAMGGTYCMSCHSVQGVGSLSGGSLGPDLTHVATRYGGQVGLSSALASLPFPTMAGVFTTRPLSPQEQADLTAFFLQADQTPPQPANNTLIIFLGIAGVGALLLFILLAIFWPRQRKSLSERLRGK
jgi:mono/diheme cytochrome c family protein